MKKKGKHSKSVSRSERNYPLIQDGKGPYVALASLCESVLQEKGGGGVSLIRVVDNFQIDVEINAAPDVAINIPVDLQGIVSFKSGDFRGKRDVTISLLNPSNAQIGEPAKFPLIFEGGTHGSNIILNLHLETEQEGLYYFDVRMEGRLMTRIPFTLRIKRTRVAGGGQSRNLTSVEQDV